MNDLDVINWTRDVMLQGNVDADVVYNAARLAEEDTKMYHMFTDYAYYEGNRNAQVEVYNKIVDYMEERGLC